MMNFRLAENLQLLLLAREIWSLFALTQINALFGYKDHSIALFVEEWNSTHLSTNPLAALPLVFTASTPNQNHSRGQLPRLCDIKIPRAQEGCFAGLIEQSLHEGKYFDLSAF